MADIVKRLGAREAALERARMEGMEAAAMIVANGVWEVSASMTEERRHAEIICRRCAALIRRSIDG